MIIFLRDDIDYEIVKEIIYFLSISFDRKNYFCNFVYQDKNDLYPNRHIIFLEVEDITYFKLCYGDKIKKE